MEMLVCPGCKQNLQLSAEKTRPNGVVAGQLFCATCGRVYPITRGIPRFVERDQYASSFSRQRLYVRRHFSSYRVDRSGYERFGPMTGFSIEELADGPTLEIGCGYGRYLDVVSHYGGKVVGVDLSTHSVELAYDFVGDRPNVDVVQADLFHLPFKPASFRRVFSLGVLHHTPDPKAAFLCLPKMLEPGGKLAVWLYHPSTSGRVTEMWRRVTPHMPEPVLYGFCVLNQALLSWPRRIPKVGGLIARIVPGYWPKRGSRFWQRVIGDFDGLSPKYASVHTPEEVTGWFREAGLIDVRPQQVLTSISGQRACSEAAVNGGLSLRAAGPSPQTVAGCHAERDEGLSVVGPPSAPEVGPS
jgi:SAM-dependent methyltransferase